MNDPIRVRWVSSPPDTVGRTGLAPSGSAPFLGFSGAPVPPCPSLHRIPGTDSLVCQVKAPETQAPPTHMCQHVFCRAMDGATRPRHPAPPGLPFYFSHLRLCPTPASPWQAEATVAARPAPRLPGTSQPFVVPAHSTHMLCPHRHFPQAFVVLGSVHLQGRPAVAAAAFTNDFLSPRKGAKYSSGINREIDIKQNALVRGMPGARNSWRRFDGGAGTLELELSAMGLEL